MANICASARTRPWDVSEAKSMRSGSRQLRILILVNASGSRACNRGCKPCSPNWPVCTQRSMTWFISAMALSITSGLSGPTSINIRRVDKGVFNSWASMTNNLLCSSWWRFSVSACSCIRCRSCVTCTCSLLSERARICKITNMTTPSRTA